MTKFVEIRCYLCGVAFGMDDYLYGRRIKDGRDFWCTNGHKQSYCETEADRLRRERDRLKQQIASKEDEIEFQQRRAAAFQGQVTKIKNRIGAGVCPCCNRSFQNLKRHMANKHPEYRTEAPPDLKVVS